MKPITALIILILTTTICFAQNLNSGGPAESHFYQELPYEEINGKIIIDVEIAGHIHKFLLDTGAPFTISDEIATELGVSANKESSLTDAVGNTAPIKITSVKNVKLGNIAFNNVPALIGTNLLFKCFGVDGCIGSNLLRSTILKFDSKNKRVVITDDASRLSLNEQNSIPMDIKKDKQSTPFFILNVGSATGDYYFDTGDNRFMSLSNSYLDVFKMHNACAVVATGYGGNSFSENGAENNNVKQRVLFPVISLGTATFKNVKTETIFRKDGSGNNSIGEKLLDYGTVTLDYLHGKLYYEPFSADTDLTEKSWPIAPTVSDGKMIIGVVWDKLKDTLKPGLQIIAIDGVSYEQVDVCNLLRQKSILQGKDQAVLTIKDEKGELRQISIVRE